MTLNRGNNLYQNTPEVAVLDNRGLTVRELHYHRHPDTPTKTDERITRHRFTLAGRLAHSIDPRLFDLQQTDNTVNPNLIYDIALTGEVVRTRSVDAGNTLMLNDITGRPVLAINATGVTRTWQYEHETLPGRPLSITEQPAGETARITERFVWAGNTQAEKNSNLAGQCVCHYDTAGLNQTNSIALNGIPLSVTRQLLPDDTDADWQGGNESAWNDRLATENFTTLSTVDATGALLTRTDAMGNVQRLAYDVAGLLTGSWLSLKGQKEQAIVTSLAYSAAGQKLREAHGNGVVTTYTYEPQTQRLIDIRTERPTGHAAGAKVQQDLRYEYDPVGNVLSVRNDAEETHFWRNQKVVPENRYVYDSLYQLVSATGREMANAGQQGNHLPPGSSFDNAMYTNYTRTYTYDRAGNLTQIRHSAPATNNNYTTGITISDHSNRGVLSTLTETPSEVDALFTAGGYQALLQLGQTLAWTPRGELLKVSPVVRDGATNDGESYRYDASSQRVLKVSTQKASNTVQTQRVLYLPGLELHTTTNGSAETEHLHVIMVGEAGRTQVRVLHWESGKPANIGNDALRYSYDNLIGSSGLEVDGGGNLISQEEYYPYGGTAILAACSAMEVDYKTLRYSGKERDATGLYYYGYRYYQPWVGRWLSADPAGTVDGLNLYRMVGNNPVTFTDRDGLIREDQHERHSDTVPGTDLGIAHRMIDHSTRRIFQQAQNGTDRINAEKSVARKNAFAGETKFTNKKLKEYAAHAAVVAVLDDRVIYTRHFLNLPGSLESDEKKRFPGVSLSGDNVGTTPSYEVTDRQQFIGGIKKAYSEKKIYSHRNATPVTKPTDFGEKPVPLHPIIEKRIIEHLDKNNNRLPMMAGIAGLHAEVQALNFALHRFDELGIDSQESLERTYIYTKRLVGKDKNADFPACFNCSGILRGKERVMTGRVATTLH
ncbi:RHS repeat-associated core domain-containing protein [Xenorhabdus sp. PB62.4]|uniref:RHS repeat-associated core domain-containing protein n=1 Tax=Xenorhabdus sp. PB62.4 TaxID=1851573 RepID=UPI001656E048|nr:RHS repeat-associated core domain-containing protein [Xenorhabdus sp. PB62.4]MBC8954991.1 insecticidal toxin, SepC/Tcc class [Xenorhabdus sp. PB62.4]